MDTTPTTLIDLPVEVITHILSYALPSGQTFLVRSLVSTPDRAEKRRRRYGHERSSYCWIRKECVPWYKERRRGCREALRLLIVHPVMYPLAMMLLYSRNTIWFPDPHTLKEFANNRFSSLAKCFIWSLRVDACGLQRTTYSRKESSSNTIWEHNADIGVAETIQHFRSLKRLTLGGVGPGLIGSIEWLEEERTVSTFRPGGMQETRISPGPVAQRSGEHEGIWPLDCIALVARIVGVEDDGKTEKPEKEDKVQDNIEEVNKKRGPLEGGTVLCGKVQGDGYNIQAKSKGTKRQMATHIVRCEDVIDLGPLEAEVEVARALERAKIENRRKEEFNGYLSYPGPSLANLGTFSDAGLCDFQIQLMLLEHQNRRRMALMRQQLSEG